MRVLHIADILPYPPNTGIKIRTYNIIKEIANSGENEVDLVCFSHKALTPSQELVDAYADELRKICRVVHVFPIPSDKSGLTRLAAMGKNLLEVDPYRVSRYWSKDCAGCVRKLAAENDYDLIHLDKTELYRYAELVTGVAVVCTNHNVESWLMKRRVRYEVSWLRKAFAYLQYVKTEKYEKKVLSRVNGYITCTEIDKEYLEKKLGIKNKHAIIDNGVDTDFYYDSGKYGKNFILIIGAQTRDATANFDASHYFMAEIWPRVKRLAPDIQLKFVGRDPDPSVLAFASDPSVEVVGFVEDEREYLGSTSALIVPLRLGGGSRLKILTAMSMGRPIVSTTIGAEGIKCTSGKDIVLVDEPDRFADEIVRVYTEQDIQEVLGRAAREAAVQIYDWKRIGERARDFLREVSEESRYLKVSDDSLKLADR